MKEPKRNAALTRLKLLDAAEQVFVAKGYDAARVDEIASVSGVNKRMIYLYFGSKEDIYVAVLKRNMERMLEASAQTLVEGLTARVQAEANIRRYFLFLAANPSYVRLVSWETLNGGKGMGRVFVDLGDRGLSQLLEVVSRGIVEGDFRKDLDANYVVVSVSALCLSYFNRRDLFEALRSENDPPPREDLDQALNAILDLIFKGVANPACDDPRELAAIL